MWSRSTAHAEFFFDRRYNTSATRQTALTANHTQFAKVQKNTNRQKHTAKQTHVQ